jgi:NACalpha-BTF3-like transcription factor
MFAIKIPIAFVLTVAFLCSLAFAESDDKEKLDVVLLLDTSASMLLTDPTRLRDQGVKILFQFLKSDDRVALLGFDSQSETLQPLAALSPEVISTIEGKIGNLKAEGQNTDIVSAIEVAREILERDSRADASQIIVLLSDGKLEPDPAQKDLSTLFNKLNNSLLPDLKAAGIRVYTVAFSELADREMLSSIALATDAISWFTPNADKLHSSYADLFLAIKKPQFVPLTSKGFRVDNNVEEVTFYISKEQTGELTLLSPNGDRYTKEQINRGSDQVRWYSADKFDVITVKNPNNGDWKVEGLTPEEGFATILTDLRLKTEFPHSIYAESSVVIEARLFEGEKPVSLGGITASTQFAYQIIPTDQVATPIVRDFLNDAGKEGDRIAGDGIFSKRIEIENAGDYKMRVVAQSQTFTRSQQMPFRVKSALVSLKIEKRIYDPSFEVDNFEDQAHGGGDESHEKDEKIENEKNEDDSSDEEDIAVIELNEEVSQLRQSRVRLLAIDEKRRRYELPLKKIQREGRGLARYEVPLRLLPREGEYELQAMLSGETRAKKELSALSKKIKYKKMGKHLGDEALVIEVKKSKKEEGSLLVGLLILSTLQLVGAFIGRKLILSATKTMVVSEPRVQDLAATQEALIKLEALVEQSEVNLDDPIFSEPLQDGNVN